MVIPTVDLSNIIGQVVDNTLENTVLPEEVIIVDQFTDELTFKAVSDLSIFYGCNNLIWDPNMTDLHKLLLNIRWTMESKIE